MKKSVNLIFDKPLPSYAQLQQALRQAIVTRKLVPGERLPEERILAKQFSLSRGTVRRALAQLEDDGLLLRHQGRGTFVAAPETLPAVPIAVVLEGDPGRARLGFPAELFRALMEPAATHGAELLLRQSADQRGAIDPAACLFLLPRNQDALRQLAASGMPVVALDYTVKGPGIDSVVFDNTRVAREATRHLISLGHRRIAYVEPQVTIDRNFVDESNSPERRAGYREALFSSGITEEFVDQMPLDERDVRRDFTRLLKRNPRPTALFAFDETVALGAWLAAQDLGLHVPTDLSITCFRMSDAPPRGMIDWSGCGSSLSELGRMAVVRALQRVQGRSAEEKIPAGQTLYVPHTWHQGSTTASPK